MECFRCLLTDEVTNIDGIYCDFCEMHDEMDRHTPAEFEKTVAKIRKQKGHQVLIGISGGFDSSYLLWYTVKVLGLKPLVLHFNNGWNYPVAEHNMSVLVERLNIDLVRVSADEEYDRLCGALLLAGVKDADIANDMYMADLMQTVARKYKIKYVFNGHDYRYEGSTPLAWSYMDAKYIRSVYKWAYDTKLKAPVQTFWKQIWSGVKQVRPYHYMDIPLNVRVDTLTHLGLEHYGPKHGENIYTKFIGYYLLPKKWGIDKREIYLSAQIRSGYITKEEAEKELQYGVEFEEEYFGEIERRIGMPIEAAMCAPKQTYKDFDHYNFRRFKPLIWILYKLKLVPYTFYKKYAT